jgi:hypothetical protein
MGLGLFFGFGFGFGFGFSFSLGFGFGFGFNFGFGFGLDLVLILDCFPFVLFYFFHNLAWLRRSHSSPARQRVPRRGLARQEQCHHRVCEQ